MRSRRLHLGILTVVVLLSTVTLLGSAELASNSQCIVLTRPGELYILGLSDLVTDTEYQITISFNHSQSTTQRLDGHGSCTVVNDYLANNLYYISNRTVRLCTITYVGVQQILLGEQRARLEITSDDFLVDVIGIDPIQQSVEVNIPQSFQIIVALCSLVPFFLLIPDVISELQAHLDAEVIAKGVYGQILAILLPLLSIGLTFLLLGGLDVFK
ncbi:MAG: hypothetical protein E4H14_16460 [Candidatus Thorarchaeota archaeon]|nr:MAG: hypothetical protein E4H14_16460 [Candidatus Thorarchaeota archaeon]